MKKINYKKLLKEFGIVFLGSLLLAISVQFCSIYYFREYIYGVVENGGKMEALTIPFKGILSGGMGGFTLVFLNLFFPKHVDNDTAKLIINVSASIILFILGFIFLGKKFARHTIVSVVLYNIFMLVFNYLPFTDSIQEEFNQIDPVVCGIIGGLLMGVGCGIIYRIGGSTGGFDVPGLIINKYTRAKLSIVYLLQDGLLVILAFVARFSLFQIVVGLISVIAYSMAVDITQRVGTSAYVCDIISDKWEEINQAILALDRGTTIVDVKGGYTNKERKLIKTMVAKNQYLDVLDIVKTIDPNAFMSMTKTNDVFGEGYSDITKYSNK